MGARFYEQPLFRRFKEYFSLSFSWFLFGLIVGAVFMLEYVSKEPSSALSEQGQKTSWAEPENKPWPLLSIQSNEQESQLILPFLQARPALQEAMENWFYKYHDSVDKYVNFLSAKPEPNLAFDIAKQFKCKKNTENHSCEKHPYHLYQTACDYQGCTYSLCRGMQASYDCEYVIVGFMDENFHWKIECYSPKKIGEAFPFCTYLGREWNVR